MKPWSRDVLVAFLFLCFTLAAAFAADVGVAGDNALVLETSPKGPSTSTEAETTIATKDATAVSSPPAPCEATSEKVSPAKLKEPTRAPTASTKAEQITSRTKFSGKPFVVPRTASKIFSHYYNYPPPIYPPYPPPATNNTPPTMAYPPYYYPLPPYYYYTPNYQYPGYSYPYTPGYNNPYYTGYQPYYPTRQIGGVTMQQQQQQQQQLQLLLQQQQLQQLQQQQDEEMSFDLASANFGYITDPYTEFFGRRAAGSAQQTARGTVGQLLGKGASSGAAASPLLGLLGAGNL